MLASVVGCTHSKGWSIAPNQDISPSTCLVRYHPECRSSFGRHRNIQNSKILFVRGGYKTERLFGRTR